MNLLKWLDDHLEGTLLVVLLSVTSILVFLQVIMRFVFQNSLTWSEELARYLFIWMIYIGVSYGIKKRSHLTVDVLDALLEPRGRYISNIIVDVVLILFMGLMTYYGFNIVLRAARLSAALSIPMRYVYLAPVTGFSLSLIRLIQNIRQNVRNFHDPDAARTEEV